MRLGIHPRRGRALSDSPSNAALAEALFELADHEEPGERRLALLKAAYAVFDDAGRPHRKVLADAPPWLRPLISQLISCRGQGALEASVQRLSSGDTRRHHGSREGFLARCEMEEILRSGPPELTPNRMRGAFHWHTRDSDGKATVENMASACQRRGSSWAVVADHSRGLEIASGLDCVGLRLQKRRIDHWNRDHGEELHLFQGLEVEILDGGDLDVPLTEREEIDCVVVAVHRRFDRRRDQTERLLRAISSPEVHVFAHPRGRHFHQRPGIKAKWEVVFDACVEHGVAVEINGFPRRQDLDAELAGLAASRGCELILASDAHAPHHLEFDAYACAIAMRAEIPPQKILNTRTAETFEDWLQGW